MPKFVPRERKRRKLDKKKRSSRSSPDDDSNAVEIIPASKSEKEQRRDRLREQLQAQQPKISGKKRKRLDKYIDNKLRKEENLDLIKKLAQTKVDTRLFHSSKKIGATCESKRSVLARAYNEREAGINVTENEAILLEAREDVKEADEDGDSEDSGADSDDNDELVGSVVLHQPVQPTTPAFGSGLKRPLDVDADGRPIIKKRQKIAPAQTRIVVLNESLPSHDGSDESESEWEGCSDVHIKPPGQSAHDDPETASSNTSSDSDYDDESDVDNTEPDGVSIFKAWAVKQRNDALGFVPSADTQQEPPQLPAIKYEARPAEVEPLPPELEIPKQKVNRTVHSVQVERTMEMQEARLALPVAAEEQKIMEAIHNNDVVVIWGATGSGKTTQVPQFLFEAGYGDRAGPTPGMIGVTQPRRVAAVSMAERVGDEMGAMKRKVAYQIRFDASHVNQDTAIKFMTDGVLLREISQDITLSKYSAIIIDEAHERSVNTDILIGMLSRVVANVRNGADGALRRPLKLIIMSATLRIQDFLANAKLFPPPRQPPLIQTEGRQYEVTMHFARRTLADYVDEAFKRVSRGHKKLPKGGMLVFLTGQNEILALQKRLLETFRASEDSRSANGRAVVAASEMPLEAEDMEIGNADDLQDDASDDEVDIRTGEEEQNEDVEFEIGQTAEERRETSDLRIHVLPLYSQLPTKDQLRVFQAPADDSRLVVLATNVAETSLTIPGIRYVFDCGRAKEKKFDVRSGVQSFDVSWISKASAAQRAGRAGRTGPGHCYRLYSSATYERDFEEHTEPEILRTPMEDVVLQLRSMGLPNIADFPFPTAPERYSIEKAERLLKSLGAISLDNKVTVLGRKLSTFPLSPRFSRMLLISQERGCLELAIGLVAALSVPELIVPRNRAHVALGDEEEVRKVYSAAQAAFSKFDQASDAIKLFAVLRAYCDEAVIDGGADSLEHFCSSNFLRSKGLREAVQLREQLTSIARRNQPGCIGPFSMAMPKPKEAQVHLLRSIVAAGFVDQVAIRADLAPVPPELPMKPRRVEDVAYMTLFPSHSRNADTRPNDEFVFVHPSSLLARRSPSKLPRFIVYSHLQRSSTDKVRMHPLTPVSAAQLAMLVRDTPLMELSKPLGRVETESVDKRVCDVQVSVVGEKGSTPWPLRTWRVRQKRDRTRGWVVEEILE